MKIIYTTILHLAVITVLCWSKPPITWFEAQTLCRNKNQSLTLKKNESTDFYWTGFHRKTSHWIKIIGCYNASSLLHIISTELAISSPQLCQEYCLQENIHKFAVQQNTCQCLSDDFDDSQSPLSPSECKYTCENSTLLSTECGGESAFNVYFTDTATMTEIKSRCLALECGRTPIYVNSACSLDQLIICRTNISAGKKYGGWRDSLDTCNMFETYLPGNIPLSNATSACTGFDNISPRWIGVLKESRENEDKGQHITESQQTLYSTCQKCRLQIDHPDCHYVQCVEKLRSSVYCSESKDIIDALPDSTDASETNSPTTNISPRVLKESGTIKIVVPVLALTILPGCAVAIVIFVRRKKKSKENESKDKALQSTYTESEFSIEKHNNTNYFVLQRSNPAYELAENSKIESESPYKEAEDGTYDHLGDKGGRKRPADNIYHNASSRGLSDLSDYDVANRKNESSEDNTYDRTGVKDGSYEKVKSDLSDYDVANRKNLHGEDSTYDRTSVEDNSYGKFNSSQVNETDYSELS